LKHRIDLHCAGTDQKPGLSGGLCEDFSVFLPMLT
jgi:hypothetical protein